MDDLPTLPGVVPIALQETVTQWEIIGRTSIGFTGSAVEFRKDQMEQPWALACERCRTLTLATHVIDRFTETPNICLLTIVDVASGDRIDERRETS